MKNELEKLKNKIEEVKDKQLDHNKKNQSPSIFMDTTIELVAGVIVGVIIGLVIDGLFNSKPLFLISCIIFAMIAAFRSIWRKYINKDSELK